VTGIELINFLTVRAIVGAPVIYGGGWFHTIGGCDAATAVPMRSCWTLPKEASLGRAASREIRR
jgi:hypothetical protein